MSDPTNVLLSLTPDLDPQSVTYVKCVYCKGIMGGCPICRGNETPGFSVLGITIETIQELIQQNREVWTLNKKLQNDLADIAGLLGEYMEKTPDDLEELINGDRILPVTLAEELHERKFPEQYLETETTQEETSK